MECYANWKEEKRSAYLYEILASFEKNPKHKKMFLDLKQAAEKQAALWEVKLEQLNKKPGHFKPDMRTRIILRLVKWFGVERMHLILAVMKIRGMSLFTAYHSEMRHAGLSVTNNLRAAIFGVNDGLVSNMSLILGMVGANANQPVILLAGISGLLAGAFSMAAGEYISVRSQRDVLNYQIEIEKQELEEYPEEEVAELSLIYQARGLPQQQADLIANILVENPDTGLNTLVREELGFNPHELVSPIGAMLSSFFSFSFGAFVPLIPFLFFHHAWNIFSSIIISGVTIFVIGFMLSLFTNQNPWFTGTRMLLIAIFAGAMTFCIGKGLGITGIV